MSIDIYTDGACSGNPGIGGWGVTIIENKKIINLHGGSNETTNNKMELTAVIKVLQYFKEKKSLTIFTDSTYVKSGITEWINKWKINGWKTANKKPVKNKDLWVLLDQQIKRHAIKWQWIKGHSNNKFNELADQLARKYIEDTKNIER